MIAERRAALLRGPLPEDEQSGEPRRDGADRRRVRDRRDPGRSRNARTRSRGGCSACRWVPHCGCRWSSRPHPSRPPADWPRSSGFELIAAVADTAAEPFEGVRRPRRLGLVLGDEHEGIDPEWLASVTDGHDPDASGGELAQRRRGGRDTWCITFSRPPRNRTDGNPPVAKTGPQGSPRTADPPPNLDWLHANLDAQSPNPRVSCALPLSTGCLSFAIS